MTKKLTEPEHESSLPERKFGEMLTMRASITGLTPLLQKSALKPVYDEDEDTEGLDAKKTKKKKLTPAEQALGAAYPMADGKFYHPAAAFRSAAIDAVSGIKMTVQGEDGKRPKQVAAAGIFTSCFFNLTEEAVLVDPDTGKPLKDFIVDTRNAVNAQGNMIVTSRPRWDRWATEIEFEYDPEVLQPKDILMALNLAGARIGVGQLRPTPNKNNRRRGKGGRLGKFTAELMT